MRVVVCAAIRAADGELLLGIRHYDRFMHRQIEQRVDGSKFTHRLDRDQGFVDQKGEWLSRSEAHALARCTGQIQNLDGVGRELDGSYKLYSEGLY